MIYIEKPADFIPEFEVSGCIIEAKGHILLLQRQPFKSYGNCWGTPGGRMEEKDNKSAAVCARRESEEETTIVLDLNKLIKIETLYVSHNNKKFIYHSYHVVLEERPAVVIDEKEHKSYMWVEPENALLLPLVEDEDFLIKKLYNLS